MARRKNGEWNFERPKSLILIRSNRTLTLLAAASCAVSRKDARSFL
jgi:hypothetical protein